MNIKDTAVSSIEAANLEGEVETQVSDQISAGATYEQNSAKFSPKTLFTRWTANTAKGGDPLEVLSGELAGAIYVELLELQLKGADLVQREDLQLGEHPCATSLDSQEPLPTTSGQGSGSMGWPK